MLNQPYLQIDRISKAFPGVQALADVSLDVNKGDIHAIAGENGAGKSTLMKILAGIYPHGTFGGDFRLDGASCHFRATTEAEAAGIVMIPQELAVVNELSIAENLFVNAWPGSPWRVAWAELYGKAHEMMGKLGLNVDPQMPIKKLGAAKKQLVLVAKALLKNVKLLILDEPTSSLSDAEKEILFDRLSKLKEHGVTSLYISHKLDEIIAISDRVTVLRDGQLVDTRNTKEITPGEIVRRMVGRPITQMYPREQRTPGDLALRVEGLTLYHPDSRDTRVVDRASLSICSREIVGIYGLMGSGRTELMQGMFGAWAGKSELEAYEIEGRPVKIASPRQAMNCGIGFLTEDRKRSGIIEGKDLKTNITVTCLKKVSRGQILDHRRERILAEELVRVLKVRTPSVEANIGNLSGGNQQKVLIARWIAAGAKILLLDEPTRGIDVGAKVEIFHLLNRLAAEGAAILFISSELPEVLGFADRIVVLHEGKIQASIPWQEATEEAVMHYATGQAKTQASQDAKTRHVQSTAQS